jgi:hypothetical protein
MPNPVVTDDYVACCICTGQPYLGLWAGNPKYLPIPKTLYCTWGSWAGSLIWNNPSLPSWISSGANLWSGIATIPFKYRTCDAYGYCNPTILDTTAECWVAFNCYGYATWLVRAIMTCQCCMELDETQDQSGGGYVNCGLPLGHCFTCDGEFSAVLDSPAANWIDAPCIGPVSYVWGHNVCDLQISNCYITE